MTYNTLANLVPAYFFLSGLAFCQVAWPWVIQHRKWLIPIWGLDASKVESEKGRSEGWNPSEGLPCSAAGMGESLGSLKPYLFTYSLTREFWGNVMGSRRQSYRKGRRWTLSLSPQVLETELVETVLSRRAQCQSSTVVESLAPKKINSELQNFILCTPVSMILQMNSTLFALLRVTCLFPCVILIIF